jgi:hypothetical protein
VRVRAGSAKSAGMVRWRASSYSNAEGGNCVEVASLCGGGRAAPGVVPVRDGRRPRGPALRFGACAWTAFVEAVKSRRV